MIPHEVGHLREACIEKSPQFTFQLQLIHGQAHAVQPLVPLGIPDRGGGVPHAEPRVPVLLKVVLGPAQPPTEEIMELVPALGEVGFINVTNGPTIWTGDSLPRCGPTPINGYYDFNSLTYGIAQVCKI